MAASAIAGGRASSWFWLNLVLISSPSLPPPPPHPPRLASPARARGTARSSTCSCPRRPAPAISSAPPPSPCCSPAARSRPHQSPFALPAALSSRYHESEKGSTMDISRGSTTRAGSTGRAGSLPGGGGDDRFAQPVARGLDGQGCGLRCACAPSRATMQERRERTGPASASLWAASSRSPFALLESEELVLSRGSRSIISRTFRDATSLFFAAPNACRTRLSRSRSSAGGNPPCLAVRLDRPPHTSQPSQPDRAVRPSASHCTSRPPAMRTHGVFPAGARVRTDRSRTARPSTLLSSSISHELLRLHRPWRPSSSSPPSSPPSARP